MMADFLLIDLGYCTTDPGRYYAQAVLIVEGETFHSPWFAFTVVPSPEWEKEANLLYIRADKDLPERAQEIATELFTRFPKSDWNRRMRQVLFDAAAKQRDWPGVIKWGREIYSDKTHVTRYTREDAARGIATALWKTGQKAEAEAILLKDLADAQGPGLLDEFRRQDREKEKAAPAAP